MTPSKQRLALYSERVVTPRGVERGTILCDQGRITEFRANQLVTDAGYHCERADNLVVMPGLVDSHVHINQPGRTEWEGFATATRAAAAGGVTTLVDMPLNSIPVTTSAAALQAKVSAASPHLLVDCGFWGGLVPANYQNLDELAASGVLGVKAFLTHSGIDDFPQVERSHLEVAMPVLARHGLPLLVHAELESCVGHSSAVQAAGTSSYFTYLHSRPDAWELAAIDLMIDLARTSGCHVHIVHLSSAAALGALNKAKKAGVPVTVETCPHYLCLAAEEVPEGNTLFKCAPPIRGSANALALWQGLKDGSIDFVVSDHSPCSPELKLLDTGDFAQAWGGIASLQLTLPLVWTYGAARQLSLVELTELLCTRPARFAGLDGRKGSIAPGYDADFVVWDDQAEILVEPATLHFRHKVTPYLQQRLKGKVTATYLRGQAVYQHGQFANEGPMGRPLLKQLTKR